MIEVHISHFHQIDQFNDGVLDMKHDIDLALGFVKQVRLEIITSFSRHLRPE